MQDLMIDLETMGNTTNAPIIAIGACFFDPETGDIGGQFYEQISLESSTQYGIHADADTVLWWLKQSDDARNKFKDNHKSKGLKEVLGFFRSFVYDNSKQAKPWGNGATFDLGILKNSFDKVGLNNPWQFWNERDVRTVVNIGEMIGYNPKQAMPFDGVPHYALDDAIHQAKYVSAIIQKITK